ncbi:hypothetical protein BDV25DRAFT_90104 [Aspergillus avenaceus]|uniref:Zn(2)-C6 fungal-type domain-containing protein n=1 Tax=Aspergillus avenaceus TaxID=36643 RepID=A0A5N6TEQ9_ASPAV|nr:hypothetical protein BDV25DRAFT_90104 [Aspergillus avenaceus]
MENNAQSYVPKSQINDRNNPPKPPDWFSGSGSDSLSPMTFNPYAIPPYYDRPLYPVHHRSSASSSSREFPPTVPKVAIPRTSNANNQYQRRRSARACEPCRQRKIKCDGNKPACRQCVEHNVSCTYLDVKRVRDQKQLGILAKRVQRFEKILAEIEPEVDGSIARRIRRSLQGSEASSAEDDSDTGDETSSIGSLEEIDMVNEDLNRDEKSIATGFFGKNSEISWMQRLEDEAEGRSRRLDDSGIETNQDGPKQPRHDASIATVSYHLDDLNLPFLDSVDAYALPPKALADKFYASYMESVHPAFMVIRKSIFTSQYRQFFTQLSKPPRRWLAILNMIFAIGCRHRRLLNQAGNGDWDDLVYLNRTRKLALNSNSLFEHADLQQIQVEFLVAFYLLSMGQVNRSFKFSSMAFRSSLSLGINLRLEDDRTHYASKEARTRLWWSIYLLEHLLTSITGRVSCVGESLSSTPLPVPFEEEAFGRPEALRLFQDLSLRNSHLKMTLLQTEEEIQSSSKWLATCEPCPSLFGYLLVDLTTITQAIINKVYSIQALREPTSRIHHRIRRYSMLLETWLSKLPEAFRFTELHNERYHVPTAHRFMRERVSLAFAFYSARITLCRPCISHANLNSTPMPQEPKTLHSQLRIEMAVTRLRSACSLTSILPDEPDLHWVARTTPWWNMLHFLMQANTALLLGLSCWSIPESPFNTTTTTIAGVAPAIDTQTMLQASKKIIRWIHALGRNNAAAHRAFIFCDNFLRRVGPSLNLDFTGLPDRPPQSPGNDSLWMINHDPD